MASMDWQFLSRIVFPVVYIWQHTLKNISKKLFPYMLLNHLSVVTHISEVDKQLPEWYKVINRLPFLSFNAQYEPNNSKMVSCEFRTKNRYKRKFIAKLLNVLQNIGLSFTQRRIKDNYSRRMIIKRTLVLILWRFSANRLQWTPSRH